MGFWYFVIVIHSIFSLSYTQGWQWLLWLKLLKFRRRSNITKWCFNMSSCRTRCRCGRFFLEGKAVKCFHRSSRARKGSRKTVIECWSSSWCEKNQVNWFLGQHVVWNNLLFCLNMNQVFIGVLRPLLRICILFKSLKYAAGSRHVAGAWRKSCKGNFKFSWKDWWRICLFRRRWN